MLEFLGIEPLADRKYYIAREKFLEAKKREPKERDTEEDDTTDLFDDALPNDDETKVSPPPQPTTSGRDYHNVIIVSIVYSTESLFHGGDRKATAAYQMPDDSTNSLFVLDNITEEPNKHETISVEDNSDLLRYLRIELPIAHFKGIMLLC